MWIACWEGHPSGARLFEAGRDITKADNDGLTLLLSPAGRPPVGVQVAVRGGRGRGHHEGEHRPHYPMIMACWKGHLSVCTWLFEVGAAEDISTANKNGRTPMYTARWEGHLSVCEWLFEVGTAADITKASNDGTTPMLPLGEATRRCASGCSR